MCYTYDSLSRLTARTIKNLNDNTVISTETFTYDAAGNIIGADDDSCTYDINNRLISFNGNTVSYDLDGNMLSNGTLSCTYDSSNRLISAGGHTYTYNAEDVRIRNLCDECCCEDTTYTYDTNAKLSRLLCKTTNSVTTKYVYGRGLIGEEVSNDFKTYHFDYRGSTVAITDISGNITDTFQYDSYGKLLTRTGTSEVIFGYNGRDGVVTDKNGLIYMRARYYSPELKRFVHADIVAGQISNAVTLNRFAYANGNPVSFVDPFGLSPDERWEDIQRAKDILDAINDALNGLDTAIEGFRIEKRIINGVEKIIIYGPNDLLHGDDIDIAQRIINADNLSKYPNIQKYLNPVTATKDALSTYADVFTGTAKNVSDYIGVIGDIVFIGVDTVVEASKYEDWEDILLVGGYTAVTGTVSTVVSTAASAATAAVITSTATKLGGTIGTAIAPGLGTVIGAGVGLLVGWAVGKIFDWGKEKYIDKIVENN